MDFMLMITTMLITLCALVAGTSGKYEMGIIFALSAIPYAILNVAHAISKHAKT